MIKNSTLHYSSESDIIRFQEERLKETLEYLSQNSPFYKRIWTHSVHILNRFASRSRILLLVQARRPNPQRTGCVDYHLEHRRRACHLFRLWQHQHFQLGWRAIGCSDQHPRAWCRTTDTYRDTWCLARDCQCHQRNGNGICGCLSAWRGRHHLVDDID